MSLLILTDIQKILGQILKKLDYFNKLNEYKYKGIFDVICNDDQFEFVKIKSQCLTKIKDYADLTIINRRQVFKLEILKIKMLIHYEKKILKFKKVK